MPRAARRILLIAAALLATAAIAQGTMPGTDTTASAANADPLVEVVSFGVTTGPQSGSDNVKPRDFVYNPLEGFREEDRSLSRPTTIGANESWQVLMTRLNLAGQPLADQLAGGDAAGWPARPVAGSRIWVESRTRANDTPLLTAIYYAAQPRQMIAARYVEGELRVRDAPPGVVDSLSAAAVTSELYLSADTIGLPESIVDDLVDLFSGEIDFHRDLKNGFKCTIVFEVQFGEGQISHPGRILAARLDTPAKSYGAYLYDGAPGQGGYYTADGRPLRKKFLQSPILFSRITSVFAVQRFHPILKLWRAHRGIDFAAPPGTPVRVTADGIMEFVGIRGAYGNLLAVSHPDGLSTLYGHLQSFKPGLKVGQPVRQGDIIGAVGMTGLATGPHLHYELRKSDQPVDPAAFNAAPQKLPAKLKASFQKVVDLYQARLAASYRTHYVQR